MIADQKRFAATLAAFDAANAEDPNLDEGQPKELLYAQRMSAMLARFAPEASEVVRLAVRAQHIQRWKTPRASYPMDRQGYLQWRTGLYKFHAETAGRIMADNGYDAETIDQVKAAVGKKGLKVNAETQLLEDVSDLVFLEHYLAGFAARHPDYDEAKWIEIIRKTWQKMSQAARDFVLAGEVSLPETLTPLILKAVA
ncbi:hypothetical protein RHDC1_00637 [Rhodocyclaceae bacterium]|jgi:hypothetical protein|nr:hypothetical protein RHDC1_00637 [Rhodocyclaceae bacterium]